MLEIFKFGLLAVCAFALVVLAGRTFQSEQPNVSYQTNFEVVRDLKKNISESLGINSESKLMYSYIPAYSHVYISEGNPLNMAITLSLRNIDLQNSMQIEQIQYFNTSGKLIRQYLKSGYTLAPIETKEIFIKASDVDGGSGANFVVIFSAKQELLPPIFEAVMATQTSDGKSFIFSSRGVMYAGEGSYGI